jgi:hypothetical protein
MSLTSDPSVSYSAQGNILAVTTSIAAGASTSGSVVDFSANSLGGWISVYAKGGASVSSTNGCQVFIYPAGDSTPDFDTVSLPAPTLAIAASTASQQSTLLPTGKYAIILKNLDATYAITGGITSNPIN